MYSARLLEKTLLSEDSQCYHLEFDIPELEKFDFEPGQFISMVGEDSRGKPQTRAYSIASAPRENRFDLCLDRVDGGFFSNRLADAKPGDVVLFHGPYGLFVLRRPLVDSMLIATGTGIAPFRAFVETLFPNEREDRSDGKHFWLVYGSRHASEIYYRHFFEKTAAEHANFHFLPTVTRPHEDWEGLRGNVEIHVRKLLLEGGGMGALSGDAIPVSAYICGLNEMVAANRAQLKELGWDRKRIIFERYD
ncbi:MAG TPA: FAD-dependent oxidoreductase [Acidobacteriaceae bacterium]|nr:FAD-dependent oxidoreductase [Acidobacteriaceae bacterium]